MILIDTQALVWLIEGNDRLGPLALAAIDAERNDSNAWISPVSIWEAAMLVANGKLALSRPVEAWFDFVLATPGFYLAELTVAIGADAGLLPQGIHGDPADRIIIATARALGCPLVTADRKILAYAAAGHLQAIDARR